MPGVHWRHKLLISRKVTNRTFSQKTFWLVTVAKGQIVAGFALLNPGFSKDGVRCVWPKTNINKQKSRRGYRVLTIVIWLKCSPFSIFHSVTFCTWNRCILRASSTSFCQCGGNLFMKWYHVRKNTGVSNNTNDCSALFTCPIKTACTTPGSWHWNNNCTIYLSAFATVSKFINTLKSIS